MKKIELIPVISEGIQIGLKNFASIFVAVLLWLITIWVPYINVGTTIAILSLPVALSKGEGILSPLFIFESKYRRYMGEFFTLIGLMWLSIFPALMFGIVPGIIIGIGWSLAIYILIDKGVAPGEALVQSNKATYGYKWTIFGVSVVIGFVSMILMYICGLIVSNIGELGFILMLVVLAFIQVFGIGCNTVIYRNLTKE
ncbi:MAG: hypothetical protein IJB39_02390 [Alistipes sp.]|nr:hypothetical protein [Alistipes sp.]